MPKIISKNKDKLFVVKKYVMAKSAQEALKKEKKQDADDCWVDEEWRKSNTDKLAQAIGFTIHKQEE
jgi:hypothetical protein